ncbi:MAG: response regulator transcription factor [Lachnospiraceae bacterium]|nr:response regulator transcription factor [Lachnospiraceae bacterium]
MEEALRFFENDSTRTVLLDINLGDGSGFTLCRLLREKYDLPILFISARKSDDDKIVALNIGGDDYIEKPYSLGVLLAKVRVVLKRFCASEEGSGAGSEGGSGEAKEKDYDDGFLRIDSVNMTVWTGETEHRLTSLEFKLLKYLSDNHDRLITKAELFDNVWNDKFTTDGTLNVHIRRVREEIEPDPKNPTYIRTVWKAGYRFVSRDKQEAT